MKLQFLNIFTKVGKISPKTPLKKIVIKAPNCKDAKIPEIVGKFSDVYPKYVILLTDSNSTAKLLGLLGVTSASATTAYATTKLMNREGYSSTTAYATANALNEQRYSSTTA